MWKKTFRLASFFTLFRLTRIYRSRRGKNKYGKISPKGMETLPGKRQSSSIKNSHRNSIHQLEHLLDLVRAKNHYCHRHT